MQLKPVVLFLIMLPFLAASQPPTGYYDNAVGKTGATLKTTLHRIIRGHTHLTYDNLWDAYYTTDDKLNGTVWDIYSDIPNGTPPYVYTFGTNQCLDTPGHENGCYNREHTFPKSWWGGGTAAADTMYTDLFHLYPTDSKVNSMRSNNPYGEVAVANWTSLNGSKLGPSSRSGYSGIVFEPLDGYKGDVARNYFYMVTRYESRVASWESLTTEGDVVLDGTSYPCFEPWYLQMLLDWNALDPVSQKEIDRNNEIYTTYQHNRNPFIDHPEYVNAVWGTQPVLPEPTNPASAMGATTVIPTNSAIDVTWTDATGITPPTGYVIKAALTAYTNIAAPVDGVAETTGTLVKIVSQGSQVAHFTNLIGSTPYYIEIYPYTNWGSDINYKTDSSPQSSASTSATSGSGKIFISEYIEGTSDNKAIEIYNGESSTLDLTKLTIYLYANGGIAATNTFTGSGILLPNSAYVIYNSSAIEEIITSGNSPGSVANFNGNDVLEVLYNGQLTDIFGTKGIDPGTSWTVAGITTGSVNKTLLRKLSITQGNTTPSGSFGTDATTSEWVIMSTDYAKNLGEFGSAWKGISGADWATSANWDMDFPVAGINVIIPDVTTKPVISTSVSARNLLVKISGLLTIGSTGALEVTGTLTNLSTLAGLVVESGGSLIESTPGIVATVKRAVNGWTDAFHGWHLLSSPVTAQAVAPDFTDATASNYDFYKWSEPANTWLNQKTGANNIISFVPGTGYMVGYASNATKQFTGSLNASDIQVSGLTCSSGANSGWHLLGNPFPSALNMNKGNWAFTNITATAKIWQESSSSYVDISADDGIIPAMNGFMVETSGSGSMTIPTAAREQSANVWYKSGKNRIKLVATDLDNYLSQECNIMVNAKATEGFDQEYDSHFLAGFAPVFYSTTGNEQLSTNTLPFISNSRVIRMGFAKNSGSNFSLELADNSIGEVKTIYLTDLKTGIITNLDEIPIYTFTASDGDDASRFELSFETTLGIEQSTCNTVHAHTYGKTLYIRKADHLKGSILLYNATGQLIWKQNLEATGNQEVKLTSLVAGIYLLSIYTDNGIFNQKLLMNQ